MKTADSHVLAAAMNARNARVSRRAEAAADFLVAIVLAALGTAALLHFALPCITDGALCLAAAVPTRQGPISALLRALHARWLRWRIAGAQSEIEQMHNVMHMARGELAYLPPRIKAHEAWISEQQSELQRLGY